MDGNKINLNCFFSIFAKKCNSHGHFKYIKKHKIIPRSCCISAIMLLSAKISLFISMVLSLNYFYSIFAKKCNSHSHFKCIKKHKIIPRRCCLSAIMLLPPISFLFISMILSLNCFYSIFLRKRNSHGHFNA